jgi:hypothetical protein
VTKKPDPKLLGTGSNPSNPNTFAVCNATVSNPTGTFIFSNGSSTQTTNNLNYNINFGSGATPPSYSGTTFNSPITVTYNGLGNHIITDSITGINGCNNTRIYTAFVGNMATGNIDVASFNRYGIAPHKVDFVFSTTCYDNTPGTEYILNFGDGQIDTVLQQNLPVSHIWSHTYNGCQNIKVACDLNNNYYNYKMTYSIRNACNTISSNVCPIMVCCPTTGGFGPGGGGGVGGGGGYGFGWFPGDTDSSHLVGCQTVVFSNTTTPGFFIDPFGITATPNLQYYWNFGDPISGVNNISTAANPQHLFTKVDTTFKVTLITWTGFDPGIANINLTADTIVKYIYIQTPPIPNFTTDNSNISPNTCIPKTVKVLTNTSVIGALGIPKYRWRVLYALSGIPAPPLSYTITTPGYTGDTTYSKPWFQFNTTGKFILELKVTNMCGVAVLKSDTILVCMDPAVSFAQSNVYYCGPGARTICPAYNRNCDPTHVSYSWSVPANVAFATGSTSASSCPVLDFLTYGTYIVTVTITNDCGQDTATQAIHITNLLANNIITPPFTQFCGTITPPVTITGGVPTGGGGSYIYLWQKKVATGIWTNINPGGDGKDYMITDPVSEDTQYRRWVYDQGDCQEVSNVVTLAKIPVIQNNLIYQDQLKCSGAQPDPFTSTTAVGGTGTIAYEWQLKTTGSWSSAGSTNPNYTSGPLTATTSFRRVATSGPCTDNSSAIIITICDAIGNNLVPASGPNAIEICAGITPAQISGSSPTGACSNYNYQWQQSTNGGSLWTSVQSGGTGQNYSPPALTATTRYRRLVSSLATTCPDNISGEFLITVNPNPVANAGFDTTVTFHTVAKLWGNASGGTPGTAGYTYCWTPAAKVNGSNCLKNVTTIPLDITSPFILTVTDSKTCTNADTKVVNVGIGMVCSVSPSSARICPVCPTNQVTLSCGVSGGSGNYTYSWTANPPNSLPSTSSITVCPAGTTSYTCLVWDGYSSCTTNSVTVTVDPVPVITSTLTKDICSGQQVNYSPTSTVAGTTYTWTTQPGTCTGNANGMGTMITDILINTGITPCSVSYIITPIGPSPNYCIGTPVTLVVNVMPVSQITNTLLSQTVVSGSSTTPVTFTSNVSNATFEWHVSGTVCPGGTISYTQISGTGSTIPSQPVSISGTPTSCELKYLVTPSVPKPSGGSCPGTPVTYSIFINLAPSVYTLICPSPVCEGTPVSITLSGSDLGISYQMYKDGATFQSPKPGGPGPLTWTGITASGNYLVWGTNTSNGQSILMDGQCTVTINPKPIANYIMSSTGPCPGDIITLNGSQAGVTYVLYCDGIPVGESYPGPGILNFTNTITPGLYKIKATYNGTGCWVWIDGSVQITPNPQAFLFVPAGDLCVGDDLSLANSQSGVLYELWCNPLTGPGPVFIKSMPGLTGSSIAFGIQTIAGTYYIHAINLFTLCDVYFPDNKVFWPNPQLFNITPLTSAVPNCGMTTIGLSSSEVGVHYAVYQLDGNGVPLGYHYPPFSELTGDGNPLVFGTTDDIGEYVVIAWNPANLCQSQMNGIVVIHASPTKYWMDPQGGPICIDQGVGLEIKLLHSDVGINYTLHPVNNMKPGGPVPLSFGFSNTTINLYHYC